MNESLCRVLGSGAIVAFASIGIAFGQSEQSLAIEIFSPWVNDQAQPKFDNSLYLKSCLNLITLKHGCSGINFHYGNRFGDNWDIFAVSGAGTGQTRGIDLGKLEWSDKFDVPEIESWPKLDPGQQRHVTINTSGADGEHGKPGRNADGTLAPEVKTPLREGYGDKPVDKQVSSTVTNADGEMKSAYSPYMQIAKDHIYAFRVVDATNDFYLLVRVDALSRGTKATISFRRL